MKFIQAVFLLFTSLIFMYAEANEKVEELIDLMELESRFEEMAKGLNGRPGFQDVDIKPTDKLSTHLFNVAVRQSQEIEAAIEKHASWEVFKPKVVALYESTYTPEEIDYALNELKSEMGKAIREKDKIVGEKFKVELQDVFTELSDDLKSISNNTNEKSRRILKNYENQQNYINNLARGVDVDIFDRVIKLESGCVFIARPSALNDKNARIICSSKHINDSAWIKFEPNESMEESMEELKTSGDTKHYEEKQLNGLTHYIFRFQLDESDVGEMNIFCDDEVCMVFSGNSVWLTSVIEQLSQ